MCWRRGDHALDLSLLASAVLAGWFIVQVLEVGMISWLQPTSMTVLALHIHSHRLGGATTRFVHLEAEAPAPARR